MFITEGAFLRHLTSVYWDSSVSCYSAREDLKWGFESLRGSSCKAQGFVLPSGMLRGPDRWLVAEGSGQYIGPIAGVRQCKKTEVFHP
jgi:hypothetical protein